MSSQDKSKRESRSNPIDFVLALQILILLVAVFFALFPVIWILSAALNPSQSMSSQSVVPPLPETRVVTADGAGTLLNIVTPNGTRVERSAGMILLVEIDGEEKELRAPKNGYVQNIRFEVGESFAEGDALYDISSSYLINFDTLFNTERKPYVRWLVNSFRDSVHHLRNHRHDHRA